MRGVFYFYTMHYFIKEVVKRLSRSKIPFSKYTFILPNKRSALFLKKEISSNILKIITKLKKINDMYKNLYKKFLIKNLSYVLSIFNQPIEN